MALPNALTDGSYDAPSDPEYGAGAGTSAPEIIAMQRHPELLNDPSVRSATTPEAKAMAFITLLKKTDPTFDPQGNYRVNPDGTVSPNNSSWFSDHLPLITGLMGAALGGAGLLAGAGAGGASGAAAAESGGGGGLAAIEGGTPGLTESGVTALGTGAMGAAPIGAAAGGAGAFDAAGNFIGDSTVSGAGSTVPITADGGAFDSEGNFIGDSTVSGADGSGGPLSTIGKYAKILSGVGGAISSATDAAQKNRIAQNDPYVQRGKLEDAQRNQDLRNVYMADKAMNPTHSPFDPVAPTLPSGNYATTLQNLSEQGTSALSKAPQYNVGSFPSLQPGVLEKIGQWAGPILKTIGSIPGLLPGS